MFGVTGQGNYIEEEGKEKGHKFPRLLCDVVCGGLCGPCDIQQTEWLGQRPLFITEGCNHTFSGSHSFFGFQLQSEQSDGAGNNMDTDGMLKI